MQLYRSEATKNYRGSVKITNGTVKIQSYESFRMDMDGEFSLDGGKVHFDRMDLLSDGARTAAIGDVDLGKLAGTDLPAAFHASTFRGRRTFSSTDRSSTPLASATSPARSTFSKAGAS